MTNQRVYSVWIESDPEPGFSHGIFWYCGKPCPRKGDLMHALAIGKSISGNLLTNSNWQFLARAVSNQLQRDYPLSTFIPEYELC